MRTSGNPNVQEHQNYLRRSVRSWGLLLPGPAWSNDGSAEAFGQYRQERRKLDRNHLNSSLVERIYHLNNKVLYYYGLGQFGFSVRFMEGRSQSNDLDAIFGAPGVFNGFGLPFVYEGHNVRTIGTEIFLSRENFENLMFSYLGKWTSR